MPHFPLKSIVAFVLFVTRPLFAGTAAWVAVEGKPGDFPLVNNGIAVPVRISADDHKVVSIAAGDFAADVERVTGQKPVVIADEGEGTAKGKVAPHAVWIGTLGRSPLIDGLVAAGKLDVAELRGKWESFLIATVAHPQPGVAQALVIVGSDRRGTAFGVYELSQAIGVSPWYWWADVVPEKQSALHVAAGTRRFGPPSVQYRGIFINDEDWGLQPWAAKTFAPEEGGIGPKVYRKVFELLLRLKANTLWPAMHACTKPFNAFPENARLADDYAIVMGSSHAEPMLRNNVGEWTAPKEAYNYVTNRDGVLKYWDERMASNGRFENVYTLGMRGIHDSNMVGPKTDAERIAALERIFADQRALIAKHVRPEVEQVPQMFCAYKEVLDLYRKGLKVPDDVTIVWPDDNFGYIRNFATAEERKQSGGFGVYYHISYLGRPLAYLWLCTTPPALIWEEMSKAYEHGARKLWIVNVGDIKPGEIGTEFFLQMAWDIRRWNRENLTQFLVEWATREFGAKHAPEIADVMATYYQLNYQRKPEHLQWWLPKEEKRWSVASLDDDSTWLIDQPYDVAGMNEKTFASLRKVQPQALYQLILYPLSVSSQLRRRYFYSEQAALSVAAGQLGRARHMKKQAIEANEYLQYLQKEINEAGELAKWRGFFAEEPADEQWKSMRIAKWEAPVVPEKISEEKETARRIFVGGVPVEEGKEMSLPAFRLFERASVSIHGIDNEPKWRVDSHDDWIETHPSIGLRYPPNSGINVGINWSKAPRGDSVEGRLVLKSGERTWLIHVPIFNPEHPRPVEIEGWFVEIDGTVSIDAEHFNAKADRSDRAGWAVIPGLGRTGAGAVALFPTTAETIPLAKAKTEAARLDYRIHFFTAGSYTLRAYLIPTHPISGDKLRFAVALDDGEPQLVELDFKDGSADWAQGVLNNTRVAETVLTVPAAGPHTLHVYGLESGVVIDKLVLFQGEPPRSYLGPAETRLPSK